jgi:hypothetical protein
VILLLLGDSGFGRLQLRQIRAAMRAQEIAEQRILVAGERAATLAGDPAADGVELLDEPADRYLLGAIDDLPGDCRIIPPPIGRHILARVLADSCGGHLTAPAGRFALPFARSQGDVLYLSAAAWLCPVSCMAPKVCPRIALERNWHLPSLLRAWAREQGTGAIVFAPRGPASGLESVSVLRLRAARRRVGKGGRFLVATAAPCHAAASVLQVG